MSKTTKKKMSFNYDDDSYDENKKKRSKKSNSDNFLKLGKVNKIAIMPGITAEDGSRKDWITETLNHEVWVGGKKLGSVGCNKAFDEDCPICEKGWKIYNKNKDSKNKEIADKFKIYMPREERFVNAVKLNLGEDEEQSVKVMRLPKIAHEEIEEYMVDNSVKPSKMFHPDKGRVLLIKSNGAKGIMVRYKTKVTENNPKLISSGVFEDEEVLVGQLEDLSKFQLEYDEASAQALLKKLSKLDKSGDDEDEDEDEDNDDVEMDDEDEDEDEKPKKKSSKKAGKKVDKDEDEDDDLDEDEDEKPAKKSSNKAGKKAAKDEDEDDDDDLDDDDEDEDEKPAKKSSKKASKKNDDDEDDDDDLDDDDLEDDDDEDEKPAKKSSKKAAKDEDDDDDLDDDDLDDDDEDEKPKKKASKKK